MADMSFTNVKDAIAEACNNIFNNNSISSINGSFKIDGNLYTDNLIVGTTNFNDIPANGGVKTSTLANKIDLGIMPLSILDTAPHQLKFIVGSDGTDVCLFDTTGLTNFPTEDYKVYVNGKITQQVFTSLSFKSGDIIHIVTESEKSFPRVLMQNYVSSLEKPLPVLTSNTNVPSYNMSKLFRDNSILTTLPNRLFANNTQATTVSECFYNCTNLKKLPSDLFDYTPLINSTNYLFFNCASLESVPEGLLDNITKTTSFAYSFRSCDSLANVPESLFEKNTNVTSFNYCFYDCTNLSATLKIGSTKVSSATAFCTNCGNFTVYVPSGSTTQTTFETLATTLTNLTVIPY